MLLLPGSILIIATVIFTVALWLVHTEQQRGARIVLPRLRGWVDRRIDALTDAIRRIIHVVSVSFMYIVHQLRAALARVIAPQPRRRKQPKEKLQFEKTGNHLSDMHDHKSDSALTPAQKKKLRNQKLEESL